MYCADTCAPDSQEILHAPFPDAVIATDEDARAFGLNAVSDGRHVVRPAGATSLIAQLRERAFEPVEVEVSELLRAGGGVKCCALELRHPVAAELAPPAEAGGLSVVVTSGIVTPAARN